ncbi:MAG: GTP-binding protein [Gordonia sp. (in: high G+C Gram-positive bacteria)]|uniref:CobW family GTP-binding protein n=1 Tax=Gordonia sp. (in: high G+C Gram-positive bacteria) TaxID=84139 RepID=UPI0039E3CF43
MPTPAVPVIVLAGFLGAGKTTVLNHLLRRSGGRRFGVLVNDFGSINVDALLVSGRSAGTMTFSNGCICCTTDADGLGESLQTLADSGVDAIVIEASGIAEPKALIRLVLAARSATVAYGGLIYVADAALLPQTLHDHPSVRDHLAVADLVVVNKTDLVDAAARDAVLAQVRKLNDTAPVLAVRAGAVDPALLVDGGGLQPEPDGPQQLTLGDLFEDHDHDHHDHDHSGHDHLHDAFESVSLESAGPVDPRRLAALLSRPPAGAFRLKGLAFVDLPGHADQAYEVHAVGGFVHVRRRPWPGPRATQLVVIGAGLDPVAARSALEEVVTPADPADEHGILHLTRYLADDDPSPTVTEE